jgi:hypothetical protein
LGRATDADEETELTSNIEPLKLEPVMNLSALPLAVLFCLNTLSALHAEEEASRVWTNQQGRAIQAKLFAVTKDGVVLQMEGGARSTVSLATLSQPDQLYVQQWSKKTGGEVVAVPTPVAPVSSELTWPPVVGVNPKATTITVGELNAGERKFHYQSGSFRFVANAALTGTVMKEIATDFELVRALMVQLPWGWQPKPKEGTHFLVYLTETDQDYIALGGNDQSSGGSKDDYVFSKFSAIGLKKVGAHYGYDAREKTEGEVVGLTSRLLLLDSRNLTYPWAALGLEELLCRVAYHNGTFKFKGLQSELKTRIEELVRNGVELDLTRLITFLHMPWKEMRSDVQLIRRQNFCDGLLLVYYFGFLEGGGLGTHLHQYYRDISQESLGWRAFRETAGKSARPRAPDEAGGYPIWALEHLDKLLAGRTDGQLRADIVAKFRSINLKFVK